MKEVTLVVRDGSTDLLARRLVEDDVTRDEEAASTDQEDMPPCKEDGRRVLLAPSTVLKVGTRCVEDGSLVLFASTRSLDDEHPCKEDETHRLDDAPHSLDDGRRILLAQPTDFEDEPQILLEPPLSLFALHEILLASARRFIASLRHVFASHRHSNPTHRFHEERQAHMAALQNSAHRTLVSLKLPRKVQALVTLAQAIVTAMTGNPHFPSPAPTLAVLTAAIAALNVAETAAVARTKGATAARNAAKATLVGLLQQTRSYVQTIADASPEDAPTIIQSAQLSVKKTPVRGPNGFRAEQGATSGVAKIVAPSAARRASYDWEYSTDGGKTWLASPSTLRTRTSIAGLPVGSSVQFRYRSVTKAGVGDWSAPASLLVK